VMLKYIEPGKTVLEIGPGAGRWTVVLQGIAKHLILVDLSQKCINLCKKRFAECDNIEFYVNDGSSLGFIPDETVDYVWSFDVFVHINPRETDIYLTELSRVLTKGGRGIIHHAKEGGRHGAWRSRMTSALFCELLEKHGLTLVAQFDSWGDVERDHVGFYDAITVFEKCVPNCSVSEIIGQHGGLE
ncbi:MAG: class I SAM-dependent methyltransferase, partial [Deltaproteobacteria bacterium]|nr:class I SAM-dependent methyltransferase [Deltaproteobacteria bacterium]